MIGERGLVPMTCATFESVFLHHMDQVGVGFHLVPPCCGQLRQDDEFHVPAQSTSTRARPSNCPFQGKHVEHIYAYLDAF